MKIKPGALGKIFILCFLLITGQADAADSVCAVVKIEIKQELTLERQAFDAAMRINNGLDTLPLENVSINVTFEDENGVAVVASSDPNATDAAFFIRIDRMDGISDINGSGVVQPSTTAEIHWLIIPAPGSGGTAPSGKLYFVGATLDYTLGGEPQSTTVTPDSIYVKPLPQLTLDYFLPAEVYADDAFTPEVEPPVPFTLGVRIQNNGSATARNVRIDSAQPTIVENEQGLKIAFTILGGSVNDQPGSNSLLIDFGDIEPNRAAVGRWQMITSLSGKFTDFTAEFSHADELGGQLTSILQATNTHHLVRDVLVDAPGKDTIRDFLAFPVGGTDATLTVYESDNIDTPVTNQSASASLSLVASGPAAIYSLSVPVTAGLMYAKVPDPFNGVRRIEQVVRSDGKYIPSSNAWLSKTRNLDNNPPTWDYWVNFFDVNTTGQYTVELAQQALGPVPPEFTPLVDQITYETGRLVFPVSATDPNNEPVTLSVENLPPGAGFTPNGDGSATFDWSPVPGQVGIYTVTFVATDPGGLSSRASIRITVNSASDTDGDGMDDQWEIDNFGDLSRDGTGDLDGDGISDLQEFLDRTNPGIVTPAAPVLDIGATTSSTETYPLTGTAQPNTEIRVFVNDTQQIVTNTDGNGAFAADVVLRQGNNTIYARAAFSTEVSKPSNALFVQYIPVGASRYYLLNSGATGSDLKVASLVDNNSITVGATTLILNRNEPGTIPASELTPGVLLIGSGPFVAASAADAADMPVPASFSGTRFVIPHFRGTHKYGLLSLDGDATVQVTTPAGTSTYPIPQGRVTEIDGGSDNTGATIITSDRPLLVVHTALSTDTVPVPIDTFPVPPVKAELWGTRSGNAVIAAIEDNTRVLIHADDGTSEQITLNAGQQYALQTGTAGTQGDGSILHIVADRPVAAIQVDDGDGMDATAFLGRDHMATHFVLPQDAQYLAIACPHGNTTITMSIIGQAEQVLTCSGVGQAPGRLLIRPGAQAGAMPVGSYLISTEPVYVMYESSATDDEQNILGNPPFSDLPNVAVPYVDELPSQVYDPSLTVNGQTAPASEVRLYVNNVLQGSTFSSLDGVFSLSATLSNGLNTIHVVTWDGVQESAPSRTASVEYVPSATSGVDLEVVAIGSTAGTADVGTDIPVHFEIRNNGTADAAVTDTGFYLSPDPVITVDDMSIGRHWTGAIAAGATWVKDIVVRIPGSIPPGTYYLGAMADVQGVQPEDNENNNGLPGNVIQVVQRADLTLSSLTTSLGTIDLGAYLPVSFEVRNQGTSYIGQSHTGFYLSQDANITKDDYLIGEKWTGALDPDASFIMDVNIRIPGSIPPGTYYLGAIADNRDENPETDETNNAYLGTAVTVIQVTDLSVPTLTIGSDTIDLGESVTVHIEVSNQGTSYIGPTTTTFYLSADPVITKDDIKLGDMWTGGIDAGGLFVKDTTVKIRADVAPGSYYFGAIADSQGVFAETDETNNTSVSQALTVVRITDLVVGGLSVTSDTVDRGVKTLEVNLKVDNLGSSYSGVTYTGIYLSTDSVIDKNDIKITELWAGGVYGYGSYNTSLQLSVWSNVPPGTYYLGAIVDHRDELAEEDETNNTYTGPMITVRDIVDLAGGIVSTSRTAAETGETIDLHLEVQNLGSSYVFDAAAVVYLSTDAVIDETDIPVYHHWIGTIPGYATYSGDLNVPLKSWKRIRPGTYYLGVFLDKNQAVNESDETNNVIVGPALTISQNADISPTSLTTTDTNLIAGQNMTVQLDVSNIDRNYANEFGGVIVLSPDVNITTADQPIHYFWIESIDGDSTNKYNFSFVFDENGGISPGTYYLGVIIDGNNDLVETDETNNTLMFNTPLTVQ